MKNIIFISFILVILSCKKEESDDGCNRRFYYYNSEKIFLTEIPNQGTVSFYDTLSVEAINQILEQYKGIQVLSVPSNSHYAIISYDLETCTETNKLISVMLDDSRISNSNKFFISDEGYTLGISDFFVCKLKNSSMQNNINELLNITQTEIIKSDTSKNHYIIRADKNANGDALEMANKFFESGYFEYAEPEFIVSYGTY